jgi:hypothetical protein
MSAGAFEFTKYEAESGKIFPIRVQPETLTLTFAETANAAPTGDLEAGLPSVKTSGGRRELGVCPRKVRFVFTGTLPTNYKQDSILQLPVLSKATYAAWAKNQEGTYTLNGTDHAVRIVGLSAEQVN